MENKNNEKGIKSVEILPEENKSEIKKSEITEEKTQRKTKISPQIKITDTDAPGKTIKISGDDIIEEIEKKEDDKNRQEQKIDNKKENNSLLKNNNLFEKQKEKRNVMKTIRTYQDDVVKLMKNQKTSLTKMVIAENKKQKRFSPKNTKQKPTKKIILIGSIISIIIVSSLGVLYFLNEQPSVPPTITELKIPTPIFPNYTQEIFLKRLKKDKIIEALQSEKESISIPLGSIIQLYLTT
ncbi:MAG TPA: hypothetical protein ENI82_04090, partial [Bacteroidetes bacterium]|nr:hypothetical protein [Bacteroidota bacterium]